MKTLLFVLTGVFCLAAHADLHNDGPYDGKDIYQVGIRKSVATTPERVAAAVATATLHVNVSNNCSVEAKLFAIRDGSYYPSTVFTDPVLLGMEYQIWVEGMDQITSGGIVHYCTKKKEQDDALNEALAATWYADSVYEVVRTQIDPFPGVRVGN